MSQVRPTEKRIVTRTADVTSPATTHHDFGLVDSKGRRIGAFIDVFEVEYAATGDFRDDGDDFGRISFFPARRYFAFRPQATRNSFRYGATQSRQLYLTLEERDAAIAAYLRNARKRAAK